jgi:hypothetical protein
VIFVNQRNATLPMPSSAPDKHKTVHLCHVLYLCDALQIAGRMAGCQLQRLALLLLATGVLLLLQQPVVSSWLQSACTQACQAGRQASKQVQQTVSSWHARHEAAPSATTTPGLLKCSSYMAQADAFWRKQKSTAWWPHAAD